MKHLLLTLSMLFFFAGLNAQMETKEELKTLKSEKEAAIAALQTEVADIDKKIVEFPGWNLASFGTIGANASLLNNWAKNANANSNSTTIGAALNGLARLNKEKYFWDNAARLGLGWQKLDTNTNDDDDAGGFARTDDNLRLTSLYGYNLFKNFAVSALGDYNTSVLNGLNSPGVLDIGVGGTYTPIQNLRIVVHPLNMNFKWVDSETTGNTNNLGIKAVVDYSRELIPGLAWSTNFTSFMPYSDQEPSVGEWTWTNGFGFSVFKGIGIGIDYVIRKAPYESVALGLEDGIQSRLLVGMSYAL